MSMKNFFNFDTDALWARITEWSRKAGRTTARPVLLLWYVLKSEKTPRSDKLLIISAISYLVLPIDLISAKRLPIIGWFDELVSFTVAYQKVCKYITPEMQTKADTLLDKWFPVYAHYEMVTG